MASSIGDRLVDLPTTRSTDGGNHGHDLVLSKTIRGYDHDLQQIREIHERAGLSFDVLVERYRDEMSHVMGDPARIREVFLVMIEDVFGELKRVAAEKALKARR